jgi:hypothetical protein
VADDVRGLIQSLWTSIQGDPVFMRRLNGWLTMFWVAMIPVSFELGWLKSVTYVSALSLWALVARHLSTWQAARVEVTQETEAQQRLDNPVEERVVEKLVAETTVESSQPKATSESHRGGSSGVIPERWPGRVQRQPATDSNTRSGMSKFA